VPTYSEAALALAALRRDAGRGQDAVSLLVHLLQRDEANLDALLALAETLWLMGRAADAAFAVARILRFDPDNAGALFNEGIQKAAQNQYREAIVAWNRVIDLEPAGAYARRARTELRSANDLKHILGEGSERRSQSRGVVHGD